MARRLLGLSPLLLAQAALAHPGHGSTDAASWLHGLEPEHLVPGFLAAAIGLAALVLRRRRRAAQERRRGR